MTKLWEDIEKSRIVLGFFLNDFIYLKERASTEGESEKQPLC